MLTQQLAATWLREQGFCLACGESQPDTLRLKGEPTPNTFRATCGKCGRVSVWGSIDEPNVVAIGLEPR